MPDTGQHDVDGVVPGLQLVARGEHRHDASVGQHDVDGAELGEPGIVDALDVVSVAHIADLGHDPAADLLDEVDGLVEVVPGGHGVEDGGDLVAEVHGDDGGALFGQADSVRTPLPVGRSRDERNLAVESTHRLCLLYAAWCDPTDVPVTPNPRWRAPTGEPDQSILMSFEQRVK